MAGGPRRGQPRRIYPGRAIVTPDDRITWSDEDSTALMLEEMGELAWTPNGCVSI
jgi:hypothetical protein